MAKRKPLPPVTMLDREAAACAASALRAAIADPATAGTPIIAHILLARPRRGMWMKTWSNLPGLMRDIGAGVYSHALLPGWGYTTREMKGEMIEDLERLAATGERPTTATRACT